MSKIEWLKICDLELTQIRYEKVGNRLTEVMYLKISVID